jgi:serine/threonine protein kinase
MSQLVSWPPDLDLDGEDDLDEMAKLLGRVLGVGTLVAGRYRLEAIIGRGGAATVWRAHDRVLERAVALKILLPRPGRDPRDAQGRFLREARLCAAIRHPNVVAVLDYGTHEERPFLVMDMLEGEALDTRLAREVQLDVSEAVAITLGILEGLHAAHTAGVAHRDLKPANVFLATDADRARPTLLDFGVSRSLDRLLRPSAVSTADGQLVGTPEYMSPEQARGSLDVDHRTDLYAAGVILYECLAGVLPYESETIGELIVEIVTREPLPLRRIRSDLEPLEPVLARALAHRPDARFASAHEMRDALLAAYAQLAAARASELRPLEIRRHRVCARRAAPAPRRAWDTPANDADDERTTEPRVAAASRAHPARASARRRRGGGHGSILVGLLLLGSGLALGAWSATRAASPPTALAAAAVAEHVVSQASAESIDATRSEAELTADSRD